MSANYVTMPTDGLLEQYRRSESVDPMDKAQVRKAIRMELFKRGVDNINGIPLTVLLRNPIIKAEYNEALGL